MKIFFQRSGHRSDKEGMHIASVRAMGVPVGVNAPVDELILDNISAVGDTAQKHAFRFSEKRNLPGKQRRKAAMGDFVHVPSGIPSAKKKFILV